MSLLFHQMNRRSVGGPPPGFLSHFRLRRDPSRGPSVGFQALSGPPPESSPGSWEDPQAPGPLKDPSPELSQDLPRSSPGSQDQSPELSQDSSWSSPDPLRTRSQRYPKTPRGRPQTLSGPVPELSQEHSGTSPGPLRTRPQSLPKTPREDPPAALGTSPLISLQIPREVRQALPGPSPERSEDVAGRSPDHNPW